MMNQRIKEPQAEQEPVHSVGDNYEHFTSYMGAEHSALLCQAYFDGADAPHEEYEAYMTAHPEQAEQEPVAIVKVQKIEGGPAFHYIDCQHLPPDTKLYLAPVRTKDLTDAEIVPVGYVDAMFRFQTCQEHYVSPSDRFKPVYTAKQIEAAVLAEREACAKVCDDKHDHMCSRAAAAIRARGDV